jgi:transcriptional regulator with XRE-family HTH domain
VLINQILREKGYTQKSLANKLEKSPSEIHKWLNGEHNFTLRSIAKLEAELGETLIEIPIRKTVNNFDSSYGRTTFKVYRSKVSSKRRSQDKWKNSPISITPLANVG